MIANNYFRSWFLVDFVSTVPLDSIFATLVKNAGALRGTKLIRMIRLVRLFKIFRLLKVRFSYSYIFAGCCSEGKHSHTTKSFWAHSKHTRCT